MPRDKPVARTARLRDARMDFRDALAELPGARGVRACGRVRAIRPALRDVAAGGDGRAPAVHVVLRPASDHAGRPSAAYQGVMRCGSVWVCPVCSDRGREERAAEIRDLLRWWRESEGGRVDAVTLTLRAGPHRDLRSWHEGLVRAWRDLTRGRAWDRLTGQLRLEHSIRVLDHTHGAEGWWHVHLHVLLLRRPAAAPATRAIGALKRRWSAAVTRVLGEDAAPAHRYGVRVSAVMGDGVYALKLGAETAVAIDLARGREMPRTETPAAHHDPAGYPARPAESRWRPATAGRRRGRSSWEVAAGAAGGDPADRAAWAEYTRAVRGAHLVTFSAGLRDRVAAYRQGHVAGVDASSVADGSRGARPRGTAYRVASIPADLWDRVARVHGAKSAVLRAAERDGLLGVARLLVRLSLGPPGVRTRQQLAALVRQLRPIPPALAAVPPLAC